MKQMKKGLSFLLALLLCASFLVLPAAADDSAMLSEVKKGVVQLLTYVITGNGIEGCTGTGFAVGTAGRDLDVIVTNWHVVTVDLEYQGKEIHLGPDQVYTYLLLEDWYFDDEGQIQNAVECEVLYSTEADGGEPDFAVLRTKKKVEGLKYLSFRESAGIASGTKVYALGYPGIMDRVNAKGGAGIDDITVTSGIVSKHMLLDTGRIKTDTLIHDATIASGNSGGPLVDERGNVIGINTYSISTGASGYAAAVASEYVMDRLELLGISYKTGNGFGNILLYIVLAVVIIVAVVVTVLAVKDGGLMRESGKVWLRGPDGSMIPVSGKVMTIGRDSGCEIRMAEGSKGISRRHCTVQKKGDGVIVTDVGSSYGTYVGETKLPVNVPVTAAKGSVIYLGGKSNQFTVC